MNEINLKREKIIIAFLLNNTYQLLNIIKKSKHFTKKLEYFFESIISQSTTAIKKCKISPECLHRKKFTLQEFAL